MCNFLHLGVLLSFQKPLTWRADRLFHNPWVGFLRTPQLHLGTDPTTGGEHINAPTTPTHKHTAMNQRVLTMAHTLASIATSIQRCSHGADATAQTDQRSLLYRFIGAFTCGELTHAPTFLAPTRSPKKLCQTYMDSRAAIAGSTNEPKPLCQSRDVSKGYVYRVWSRSETICPATI